MEHSTIDWMLGNEKYIGQVLMQKTYTPDFLTSKQAKNKGELPMYLIENAHEPIINKESFEKVQRMKGRTKGKNSTDVPESEGLQMLEPTLQAG